MTDQINYPYKDLAKVLDYMVRVMNKGYYYLDALKMGVNNCDNPALKTALNEMYSYAHQPSGKVTDPMHNHPDLFPPAFIQITQIGIDTRTLDMVWAEAAKTFAAMAEEQKKN